MCVNGVEAIFIIDDRRKNAQICIHKLKIYKIVCVDRRKYLDKFCGLDRTTAAKN